MSENFRVTSRNPGDMNPDRRSLADAIQAANSLLEQFRIGRQIEKDEMMRELEVAAFAADFRTDQDARAFFFREERGVAIALQKRQTFVKERAVHLDRALQTFV